MGSRSLQGDHLPGKPGCVRSLEVRENGRSWETDGLLAVV